MQWPSKPSCVKVIIFSIFSSKLIKFIFGFGTFPPIFLLLLLFLFLLLKPLNALNLREKIASQKG